MIIQNGAAWFAGARTLIQPRSGRVLVVLPDRIYVLSTFTEAGDAPPRACTMRRLILSMRASPIRGC